MATTTRVLSEEQAHECAVRIDDAERHRLQVRQLSIEHPAMTIEDAYAVQGAWVSMKLARGGRLRGRKVGLTSRAMQMSSQIDEPDYGDLLEDMFFDDGCTIPAGRFIVPRVEVELAFVLRDRLAGPGCTLEDVLSATDYVTPAIEIIDARIQQVDPATGAPRRVTDTISDNAANAGVVVGGHAAHLTRQIFGQLWLWQATHANGAPILPSHTLTLVHDAVLAKCDRLDGVNEAGCFADERVAAFGIAFGPRFAVLGGFLVRHSHEFQLAPMPALDVGVAQHARGVTRRPVKLASEIHHLRSDGVVARGSQRRRMHAR